MSVALCLSLVAESLILNIVGNIVSSGTKCQIVYILSLDFTANYLDLSSRLIIQSQLKLGKQLCSTHGI